MPKLSAEDKQKIREKNYANILKKLKDGKTLSKYENDLLDEMSSEPESGGYQNYYDSMAQAAKALGVDISVLKRVKRQGAPGFRGSRVYINELLPWLTEYLNETSERPETKEDLEIRKLKGQCQKIEFDLEIESGKYVEVAKVAETLHRTVATQRSILTQKLENEYPSQVCGLDPAQVRVLGKRVVDDICRAMREAAEEWDI